MWCTAIRPSRFWPKPPSAQRNLIVLGATDRSAFENLTRDRTIYQVLAHARCPVLTLREPQGNAYMPKTDAGNRRSARSGLSVSWSEEDWKKESRR